MQDLSNNDIDKLFKDAAENHRPAFDAEDWKMMSQQLDAVNAKQDKNKSISDRIVIGVVVIASLMLGWYGSDYLSGSNVAKSPSAASVVAAIKSSDNTSIPAERVTGNESKAEASNEEKNSHSDLSPSDASSKFVKASGRSEDSPQALSNSLDRVANGKSKKSTTLGLRRTTNNLHHTAQIQSTADVKRFGDGPSDESHAKDAAVSVIDEPTESKVVEQQLDSADKRFIARAAAQSTGEVVWASATADSTAKPENARKSYKRNRLASEEDLLVDSLDLDERSVVADKPEEDMSEDVEEDDLNENEFYRISIRALVSPDYSSDRFKGNDKAGLNYGIELGYSFTRNLSAHIGLISARKYYSADRIQYDVYETAQVKGDCRMWDIPLNLRYQFFPGKRLGVFVNAGLSSYLMDEENYVFDVQTAYGKQAYRMEVENGNREWFKMMNVSIGFQKKVTNRFTLQVEPFIKIPLAGVGAGKVELASFGSFFAVQFNLMRAGK